MSLSVQRQGDEVKSNNRQSSKRLTMALVAITVILALGAGCSTNSDSSRRNYSGNLESITVAHAQFEPTALFCIAIDQQYFRQNGLNVISHKHHTGAGALDEVLNGKADVSVGAAEFPLVNKAFKKETISTIGSIGKTEFIYLIGRKDLGIEKVSDLKGKRIGTTAGTIAEFYLGRFLDLNSMDMQDIVFVDIKAPTEYGNAIANGDVDAIVSAQPNANSVKERLGANAVFWPVQSNQHLYSLIISTNEWITKHPEQTSRFLTALAQAEEYATRNPAKAKAIVQKQLNLDTEYMETVWSQNKFSLSLDQSLVLAMEDEARWMMNNKVTTETAMPDFNDYIYEDGLKAVNPDAVNIIR